MQSDSNRQNHFRLHSLLRRTERVSSRSGRARSLPSTSSPRPWKRSSEARLSGTEGRPDPVKFRYEKAQVRENALKSIQEVRNESAPVVR